MKVVMLYEVAQDGLPKARIHYEAHRARLDAFHARGVLLMAGPFVLNGIVDKWSLRDWNEVLA